MGLISSAIGAAGSIVGGISTAKKMKQVRNNINDQMQKNEDWYNRRYNEDATQRADAQALLTRTQDELRRSNKGAAATQAVMGGTEESVAATKAANNKALSDAVSNINEQADARKDAIESQYLETDRSLNDELNKLTMGEAKNIAQAVQGVTDAAGNLNTVKTDTTTKS